MNLPLSQESSVKNANLVVMMKFAKLEDTEEVSKILVAAHDYNLAWSPTEVLID